MSAIVETRDGKLEGRREGELLVFRGIPYAAPPVGTRRWLPPERPAPWSGVREAHAFGAVAPQNRIPVDFLRMMQVDGEQSEDCLTLNVWTPALDRARRPLLVWIHGGGFTLGASSQAIYDGATLARRGDAVVVSINYRLGPLGFLNLRELTGGRIPATGNEGLLDQVAALEWVRDNAEAFGGDPRNVTIFGESAGGMAVGSLLGMPRARGLFQRAIPQSGAANTALPLPRARRVAERLVAQLGLRADDVDALRAVPVRRLLEAGAAIMPAPGASRDPELAGMPFQPVVDGDVLPALPLDTVRAGNAAGVPVLVGCTLEEWKLFAVMDPALATLDDDHLAARLRERVGAERARPLADAYRRARAARGAPTSAGELFMAIEGDRAFRIPALRLAAAQVAHEPRVYSYLFTWKSPAQRGAFGACHGLELGFLFGTHAIDRDTASFCGSGPAADELALALQDAWLAFARSGDPSCPRVGRWPAFSAPEQATMLLGEKCAAESAPYDAERVAWDAIPDANVGTP